MARITRVDAIPEDPHTHSEALTTIEEFLESGYRCALVESDSPRATPKSFSNNLGNIARKHFHGKVAACIRSGKVYLERLDGGQDVSEPDAATEQTPTKSEPRSESVGVGHSKQGPDGSTGHAGTAKARKAAAAPASSVMPRWTSGELAALIKSVAKHGADWERVARDVTAYGYTTRTAGACRRYALARLEAGKNFYRKDDGSIGVMADA